MPAYHKQNGKTLCDAINDIYRQYGYCQSTLHSYTLDGAQGIAHMRRIMQGPRTGIETLGGLPVEEMLDFQKGIGNLPKSDVLQFRLAGDSSLTVRPSGNEPKLKVHLSVCAADQALAALIASALIRDFEGMMQGCS